MKFLLCLLLGLCMDLILQVSTKQIPNKYKNNPFFQQEGQKPSNKYDNNIFFQQYGQKSNEKHENNPFLNPKLSREQLRIKYAHNPFLSQLFSKNRTVPINRQPVEPTNKRLPRIRSHRNFYLLPSRDSCGLESISDKIAYGHEAEIGEYPWMVLLEYRIKHISLGYKCAGILINDRYVLTAAHCVRAKVMSVNEQLFRVRLGEHNLDTIKDCDYNNDCNDPPIDVEIEEAIMHPDYDVKDNNFHNDIALLRLTRKITMTDFIKPICLPLEGEKSKPGVHLHVSGWGIREDDGPSSNIKLTADIPYIRDSYCQKLWKEHIDIIGSQFCAGGITKTNVCKGDSGGPIMATFKRSVQWYAEGIISVGKAECGGDPFPSIYTRVSSYIHWILDNLKE